MITEYICYKCKCDKCSREWITKSHDVPNVCPKCHSVKWNEFSAPASQQISEQNVAFVDVRTRGEYTSGHAKGAINMPLDSFSDADIAKLKQYADVYVICQSGGRSAAATKALKSSGVNATNVSGGTSAWRSQGLPME